MNTKDVEKFEGNVLEALPNTMFKVELKNSGRQILATLKGILRKRYTRIFPGDRVVVEITKYDPDRGRIVQKLKNKRVINEQQ